jgi:hypothetical protein
MPEDGGGGGGVQCTQTRYSGAWEFHLHGKQITGTVKNKEQVREFERREGYTECLGFSV